MNSENLLTSSFEPGHQNFLILSRQFTRDGELRSENLIINHNYVASTCFARQSLHISHHTSRQRLRVYADPANCFQHAMCERAKTKTNSISCLKTPAGKQLCRWTYCMPSLLAPTRDETWVQTLHDIALVMEKSNRQRPSDAFLSIALCKPSRIPTWPSDHCEVKTALVNKRNFVSTAVACVHF